MMEEEIQETGVSEGAADPLAVTETHSEGEQPKEEFVPLSALQAERKERQQLQENVKMLQDHMSLMQANQQAQPKQDEYSGMADDDVLTVGEAKKFIGQMQQKTDENLSEIRVSQKYNDYNEVVTKYLPDMIKKFPSLSSTLQSDPNKFETAYLLAKQSDSYRETKHERKKSSDAERIVQNTSKPGSLSAVGSSAPKGSISNWKHMSDDDFMKQVNKNMGHF